LKEIKIAIVGCEESKWKLEQIPKVKSEIKCILLNNLSLADCLHYPPYECKSVILVSGHCPKGGVDIWAEEIADELGIKKEIYPAEVNRWVDWTGTQCERCGYIDTKTHKEYEKLPIEHKRYLANHLKDCGGRFLPFRKKGYRSRNIQIAEACDVLYCIVPRIYCCKQCPKYKNCKSKCIRAFAEECYSGDEKYCQSPFRTRYKLQCKITNCIHCSVHGHPTNGGCWTMKYAKKLGKETHLVVIE